MTDRVLEGVDASRRAGWARAFAAERRVAELERLVDELEHECDQWEASFNKAIAYTEEWKRRALGAEFVAEVRRDINRRLLAERRNER